MNLSLKSKQAKTYAIIAMVGVALSVVLLAMDKISPMDITVAIGSYVVAIIIHTLLIECMFAKCNTFPKVYYYVSVIMAFILIFVTAMAIVVR